MVEYVGVVFFPQTAHSYDADETFKSRGLVKVFLDPHTHRRKYIQNLKIHRSSVNLRQGYGKRCLFI